MAGVLLLAETAAAQQRPAVRPSRDVAVEYRVEGTGAGGAPEARMVKMFWTDHGSLLRLDQGAEQGFAVVNFATARMMLVLTKQRAFGEVPFDPSEAPGLNLPANVAVNRLGGDTVAGLSCTVWGMQVPQGNVRVCITPDGLVLRVRGTDEKAPAAMEAVSVAYGPQPASLFQVPEGYKPLVKR